MQSWCAPTKSSSAVSKDRRIWWWRSQEVVTKPHGAAKDTVRKRWTYEVAGVPEYLIVDLDEQVGLLLRQESRRYEETQRMAWGTLVGLLGGRLSVTGR